MSLADSLKQRFSRPDTSADPAYAFGAEEDYPQEQPPAPRRSAGEMLHRAGAFLGGLRERIAGGSDPGFDDPYYAPQPEDPYGYEPEQPYYESAPSYDYGRQEYAYPPEGEPDYGDGGYESEPAYAPEPEPGYDYNSYAQSQAPAEPAQEDFYGSGFYGAQPQPEEFYPSQARSVPPENYAQPAPAYYEPPETAYDDQPEGFAPPQANGPGGASQTPVPNIRRRGLRPGELRYLFWSAGIVTGMVLTVVAFIYGCVV